MKLNPEEKAAVIGDFLSFTKHMFRAVKGFDFIENHHHVTICETLEKVVTGDINRLIINIPPRHGKSEIAVVNFIAWTLGLYPDSEYINVSYAASLAENNAYNVRTVVEHEAYKELFPYVSLKKDSKARNKWETEQGGVVHSMGIGGTTTGKGAGKMREGFAGCIIIDDPLKPNEANSDTVRNKTNNWFSETLQSRTNKKDTPIILIMQRLHEDDLSGFLLGGGNGEEWVHLNMPAEVEEGVPLWEFKHSWEDLKRMELADPYTYSGQYMQRPAPIGGGVLKESWFNYFNAHTLPAMKYTYMTADTAMKAKESSDFSVIQHWGYGVDGNIYLLDMLRGKWEAPELERNFINFYHKCVRLHKIRCCYVEDKASGTGLIQTLRKQQNIPIRAIQRNVDKVSRMYDGAPWLAQGRVYVCKDMDQWDAMKNEIVQAPNGKHDDTIDPMLDAIDIAFVKDQGEYSSGYGGGAKSNSYSGY